MTTPSPIPSEACHVVAIIGGAVAGSEAAAVCAARGLTALVLDQGVRPFGKIEDGLPRWHDKLRQKECEQIGRNLSQPGVVFLPQTQLGRDITLSELREQWGVNAVLLASGAWRDRPLFPGAEQYIGRGLVQQNAFVHWYNHYPEQNYAGESYDICDGALVVGGGLASIDVVKIVNFELYKRAFAKRGIRVTTLEIEHEGLPLLLAKHNLTQAELGIQGVTLFYRREKVAMPIAPAPDNATPQQLQKVGQVRAKLMDKVIEKYLVNFEPNQALDGPIVEDGRLVGLRFRRTETVGERLVMRDEVREVRSPLIISSIGSIPLPLPGLPMKGELIDFENWETGKVRGFDNVFGLGNALTGKGNIKDSRKNASEVSCRVCEEYLLGDASNAYDAVHEKAHAAAERVAAIAEAKPKVQPAQLSRIAEQVAAHWRRAGYDGRYEQWIKAHEPAGSET